MGGFARVAVILLACLVALSLAWSKEDHEIFRLNDEVQAHEGHNTTFYSFLALPRGASQDDINKAYRKLSRTLHPDKARSNWIASYNLPKSTSTKPGAKPTTHVHKHKQPSQGELNKFDKEASARFERLSLVTNILRGPERKRYDHFLSNGFPKWRGTGYYYERFRPGLGSVILGLFVVIGGGAHYVVLYMNWKKQREFVERYIKHARRMAWGDEGGIGAIPGLGGPTSNGASSLSKQGTPATTDDEGVQYNRKQKRQMEKEKKKDAKNPMKAARAAAAEKAYAAEQSNGTNTPVEEAEVITGPVGAKKRTVAENGKVLIVDSMGNVFLEEETEEGMKQEFLLDPDEVSAPSISDTFLVRGPVYLYNISLGKLLHRQTPDYLAYELAGGSDGQGDKPKDATEAAIQSALPINMNANGEARKRRAKGRS